jgi:hypothetical protein
LCCEALPDFRANSLEKSDALQHQTFPFEHKRISAHGVVGLHNEFDFLALESEQWLLGEVLALV